MTTATGAPFDVTVIPIETYQHFDRLTGLVDDANEIATLFAELGGVSAEARKVLDVDETSVKRLMYAWTNRGAPSSILVWLGHGADDDGTKSRLACFDTPDPIVDYGLHPAELEKYLQVDWDHRRHAEDAWTIVIFEACGAAIYVNQLNALLSAYGIQRVCLISATGGGAAYLGRLRQVVTEARRRLTMNDSVITTRALVDEFEDALPGNPVHRGTLGRIELPRRVTETALCATFDLHAELGELLARVPPDERNHFFPKARSTELTESGFHFVGREQETARIYEWLSTAPNGLLVVTGGPGSGKSALLGNLLLQTSPRWCALLEEAGWQRGPVPPPEAGSFDAAIHLTGLDTADLVHRLAKAAGVQHQPGSGATWSESDTEALLRDLASRRLTLLADGLDEAVDPIAIASTVLRRLAGLPEIRVVCGTRPSSPGDLIAALGAGPAEVIRLGNDQGALAEYVRGRLAAAPVSAADVDRVVTALTTRPSGTDFLYARLAVHEILARPSIADDSGLAALHTGDHRALFAIAVDRLAETTPHALALLRVLAVARGRGIPRSERMWARAASSLDDGSTVTEADIDLLLKRAAPYIMIDAEYGMTVYRLAHQTYKSVLIPEADHG